MNDRTPSVWYAAGLRFECTRCGNCCTGPAGHVWFDPDELNRMAVHFGLLPFQFLERYAVRRDGRWSLAEVPSGAGRDCVFLVRDAEGRSRCSIYELRPTQCRTWPFWPSNLQGEATWQRARERCPGIGEGARVTVEAIQREADRTPR